MFSIAPLKGRSKKSRVGVRSQTHFSYSLHISSCILYLLEFEHFCAATFVVSPNLEECRRRQRKGEYNCGDYILTQTFKIDTVRRIVASRRLWVAVARDA